MGAMHSILRPTSGDTFPDLARAVYVSTEGNNTNDGLSPSRPVSTLQNAATKAGAISGAGLKWVICLDASVFIISSVYVMPDGVGFYLPNATINGDISGPMSGTTIVHAYSFDGDLGLGTGDKFYFGRATLGGPSLIQAVAHDDSILHIDNLVSGQMLYGSGATGHVRFEIGLASNPDGFLSGVPASLTVQGWVGSRTIGATGVNYTSPTPASNELLAGTGEVDEAQASGITLNTEGNIPFNHVGSGDITLTGSGGSLTINTANISQYRDRTIFINHTNTFTLNIASPAQFRSADVPMFRLRVVNLTDSTVGFQSSTGVLIGGVSQQRPERDDSVLIELPSAGLNYPVLAESFGSLTARLVRGFQAVTADLSAGSNLNAHHLRKDLDAAATVTIEDGLRAGSYYYFQNRGLNALTVNTEAAETIEGAGSFEVARGYLYLITKDNSDVWRLFLINQEPLIENGVPRYDSLAPGKPANPGTATQEFFTFKADWQGNKSLEMTINGASIAAFATVATGLAGGQVHHFNYAITQSEWADAYTPSPAELSIIISDSANSEVIYETSARSN